MEFLARHSRAGIEDRKFCTDPMFRALISMEEGPAAKTAASTAFMKSSRIIIVLGQRSMVDATRNGSFATRRGAISAELFMKGSNMDAGVTISN
jgi:hypothetical protein